MKYRNPGPRRIRRGQHMQSERKPSTARGFRNPKIIRNSETRRCQCKVTAMQMRPRYTTRLSIYISFELASCVRDSADKRGNICYTLQYIKPLFCLIIRNLAPNRIGIMEEGGMNMIIPLLIIRIYDLDRSNMLICLG